MRSYSADEIQDSLDELDVLLKRLRIEYELYFAGSARREPAVLRAKVQKVVTRLVNEPPRNSAQKFRFNTLNSRYQCFRQHWGRILREIEAGTYNPHKFRAKLRVGGEDSGAASPTSGEPAETRTDGATAIDRLHDAFKKARQSTGESIADLSREKLAGAVKRQTAAIRERHGKDAKVRFRIVVEEGKARLKAAVKA